MSSPRTAVRRSYPLVELWFSLTSANDAHGSRPPPWGTAGRVARGDSGFRASGLALACPGAVRGTNCSGGLVVRRFARNSGPGDPGSSKGCSFASAREAEGQSSEDDHRPPRIGAYRGHPPALNVRLARRRCLDQVGVHETGSTPPGCQPQGLRPVANRSIIARSSERSARSPVNMPVRSEEAASLPRRHATPDAECLLGVEGEAQALLLYRAGLAHGHGSIGLFVEFSEPGGLIRVSGTERQPSPGFTASGLEDSDHKWRCRRVDRASSGPKVLDPARIPQGRSPFDPSATVWIVNAGHPSNEGSAGAART